MSRRRGRWAIVGATVLSPWTMASCGREPLPPAATSPHGGAIVVQTAYAPSPALGALVTARIQSSGADVRLAEPSTSAAEQIATLNPLLSPKSGLARVVVAPIDLASVSKIVAHREGGPQVIGVGTDSAGDANVIRIAEGTIARRLASHAKQWANGHGGIGRATVIAPPASTPVPDWSVFLGRGMAKGIARELGSAGFDVSTVEALGAADAGAALAARGTPSPVIIGWNDLTALAAAAHAPANRFIAAAGSPAPSSAATIDALRSGTLDLVVGARLGDFADELVRAATTESDAHQETFSLPVRAFNARNPRLLRAARADYTAAP